MNKKDDTVYLRHILDAINRIEEYLQGVDEKAFDQQPLLQDGVKQQLQVIGEATRKLSADLRARYSSVPWQDIAGMRSKLVHDYFAVDLEAVWEAATKDVPSLKGQILQILNDLTLSTK